MGNRINYNQVDSTAIKGLLELEKYVHESTLDQTIFELVKFRASQINGCAYCLDMHSIDARANGETEQRLYLTSCWREAPKLFNDKEKAALEWTEALTLISEVEIEDELYERVHAQFGDKEMLALTMTIIAINGWNRLAIPFQSEPGHYKAGKH
ncbi:MAG: carboxymuconolactone decarboxylase family protein [Brumimicrobium sp.]|nr:carboxymuconolactone decarboxylase family protein [Brumimicrobium sp.]